MRSFSRACMRLALVLAASLPAGAQTADETGVARAVLAGIQPRSIAENREYCGYIGYTARGQLATTRARRGQIDYCKTDWPRDLRVVASWHTHAGYDERAWSEVPTVNDMNADRSEGVNGYIATPGGRVWFIDTRRMRTRQVCGPGCVPPDPRFVPGAEGYIAPAYTYRELQLREEVTR